MGRVLEFISLMIPDVPSPNSALKELFAGYLADNGYAAAASAYRELAEEYRSCEGLSLDAKRQMLIDIIGPAETHARTLY